jgi:tripartite ATP-independent transporter DctM subunit
MIWILFVGFFGLMALGMPIALALGIPCLIYIIIDGTVPTFAAIQTMVGGANTYPLLAVPFFILAGNVFNSGGVTERLYHFSGTLVGHIKGGLAHVNVVGSMIFAGMSGAAIADAGGIGNIEIQAMRKAGYNDTLTIGITAASATIGPIIPPSMIGVIYCAVAQASVGRLFAAGFIPGILMGLFMMVQVYLMANKFKTSWEKRATFREILRSFYSAFGALFAIVIILGGIFSGIFTATEAAAVASVYGMILGFLMYRDLSLKGFFEAFRSAVKTTIQIMFIVVSATLFAWILAKEQFPQMVAAFMLEKLKDYYLILFSINVLLLIIGCFMETVAVVNILVPVFIPIMHHLNIDPVHFGVIMILNLMIGVITPPFGSVLFVLSSVANVPVEKAAKGAAIFIIPILFVLFLVTVFPPLALFLPNLIYGK